MPGGTGPRDAERSEAHTHRRRSGAPLLTSLVASACVIVCAPGRSCRPVAATKTDSRAGLRKLLVSNRRRERSERESTTVGQADVREVQDHPPERAGPRDLLESAPQAKARLRWHASRVSTSPSTSGSRSA